MEFVLICPFCRSMFIFIMDEDDECPECEVGNLIKWEEYELMINSSFNDAFSLMRGNDE